MLIMIISHVLGYLQLSVLTCMLMIILFFYNGRGFCVFVPEGFVIVPGIFWSPPTAKRVAATKADICPLLKEKKE